MTAKTVEKRIKTERLCITFSVFDYCYLIYKLDM